MSDADIDFHLDDELVEKKESPLPFIGLMVALSLIAVGAGWFLTGMLQEAKMEKPAVATSAPVEKAEEKESTDNEEGSEAEQAEAKKLPQAIMLEPIIVALRKSENTFIRLELAILPKMDAEIGDEETKLRIGSDIAAFVQTMQLQQVLGPTGYLHLREDLVDRVRLVTDDQVKDVLIISMVAE